MDDAFATDGPRQGKVSCRRGAHRPAPGREDHPGLALACYARLRERGGRDGGGKFLILRQRKYAVEGVALAPVGGYLDEGEEPLAAARRELREETGYESRDWIPLGSYAVDGNRGAGKAHLFAALNARRIGSRNSDDLEEQEMVLMARPEVESALMRGEFKVLPWAAAVALALRRIS